MLRISTKIINTKVPVGLLRRANLFVIMFVIFIAFGLPKAYASSNAYCEETFRETGISHQTTKESSVRIGETITTDFSTAQEFKSVEIISTIKGHHGGERKLLSKTNDLWLSKYSTFNFDIQGDPRWFIGAAGEKVAKFFGFEIYDHRRMTIPTASEFQGAIDKVNRVLVAEGKEPINIKFLADDLKSAPLSGYLKYFTNNSLPMAKNGHHLIHDMSLHSGVIYTPPRILEAAILRTKFILSFMDFLSSETDINYSRLNKEIRKYVKAFLTRGIDNGTAFGNLLLIAENTSDPKVISQIAAVMSSKNDLDFNKHQLAMVPTIHLLFGALGIDSYYKDSRVQYNVPERKNVQFTLENYSIDMYLQFSSAHFKIINSIDKSYLGDAFVYIDPSYVASYISSKMNEFKKTPEGRNFNFDLARVFSPNQNYHISRENMNLNPLDIYSLQSEYKNRAKEIHKAVEKISHYE